MNITQLLAKLAHYALAGLGVVLTGIATHITQGDVWTVATLGHWAVASLIVWVSSLIVTSAGPAKGAAALLLLSLVIPLSSCSPPAAQAAPVMASGPVGLTGFLAPGDSLGPYTFTVPSVPGATGYKWTATASATNGAWTNLPAGTATTVPAITFTLASGGTWDSVNLQLCVTGTSPVRSAKAPACTTWRVMRYLPSPTSLTGDSSKLGPISFMVRADGGLLPTWGPSQRVTKVVGQSWKICAFWRFGSGHVLAVGVDTTGCGAIAAAQFRADRLTGFTAAERAWQSGACLAWSGCLSGLGLGPRFRMPADVLLTHRA